MIGLLIYMAVFIALCAVTAIHIHIDRGYEE